MLHPLAPQESPLQSVLAEGLLTSEEPRRMPDFKIFSQDMEIVKAADQGDGFRRIRCIASSSVRDLHGDTMTEHCIRSMSKQAAGMTIFLNHSYQIPEDVFGSVEGAKVRFEEVDGERVAKLQLDVVLDEGPRVDQTYRSIENGRRLGVSIGAYITDYDEDPEGEQRGWFPPLIINDVDLLEASIVGIPANQLSWVEGAKKGILVRKGAISRDASASEIFGKALAVLPEDPEEVVELSAAVVLPPLPIDGPEQIVAHYQMQIDLGLVSTDRDPLLEAVGEAIALGIDHGQAANFASANAEDLTDEILSLYAASETETPGESGGDAAAPEADEASDAPEEQEAPESNPGDGADAAETVEEALAQVAQLEEKTSLLNLSTEAIELFTQAMKAIEAERTKRAATETRVATLEQQLAEAHDYMRKCSEFVNRILALPIGRKVQMQREVDDFYAKLANGPYGEDVLEILRKGAKTT